MRRPAMTVARQMLALQAVAVLLAVLGVTPVLAVFEDRAYRDVEARRALATAETVASTRVLQWGLATSSAVGVPGEAERTRSVSGSEDIVVLDRTNQVVYSSDPSLELSTGHGTGTEVRVVPGSTRLITATVPVVAGEDVGEVRVGDLVGHVTVTRAYPQWWHRLGAATPALLTYVAVGAAVGLVGSMLISRRIKRVTLGLEPREIRGLVEHQDAMLHGLREGVVGVDLQGRVTVVNDEARRLLALPELVEGRRVGNLGLDPLIEAVVCGRHAASDLPVSRSGRMLVLNQMPAVHERRQMGWVTTVRDRTEHVELARQVAVWRDTTDVLRAQAHEFSNRIHTVTGLVELGQYDDLARYVDAQRVARAGWTDLVLRCVRDGPLAALLVAKGSQAAERGLSLDLAPDSGVDEVPADLAEDLLTVVGNLIDNAMDAVAGEPGRVTVELRQDDSTVQVSVSDTGPGPPPGIVERIFETGFTTKPAELRSRGWGLALCRMACEQRGGTITVHTADAVTRFDAVLPYARPKQEVGDA